MRIVLDEEAVDKLSKLGKKTRRRIFDKILSTKKNPFSYFKRLSGRKDYRLRVGDYRVIADISKEMIQVTNIGHRRNIYKN